MVCRGFCFGGVDTLVSTGVQLAHVRQQALAESQAGHLLSLGCQLNAVRTQDIRVRDKLRHLTQLERVFQVKHSKTSQTPISPITFRLSRNPLTQVCQSEPRTLSQQPLAPPGFYATLLEKSRFSSLTLTKPNNYRVLSRCVLASMSSFINFYPVLSVQKRSESQVLSGFT